MFLNMDQLEKQLDNDEFQEIGSMASFKVLETQFQMFIKSRIYLDDEYVVMTRNYFLQYTQLEIPEFRDTLMQHMESANKLIDERALHKREYDTRVNERQMQTTEGKVDMCKALDTSLVDIESSETESKEQDTSNRSGNDAYVDDVDIRPIYDEEPMAETTELSNQSLESENISLKEGKHGQFSKVKSTEAKVKHDIDVTETKNIELEHKVAKLLKENKTLKRHYKELFDSIKTTRAKTIEHTTSLIAQNAEFKAQLQEKGFAIAALKNKLGKLTENSVNTKFAKSSILGKPFLQPHRNQSVVRQPTAFKSEQPRISKPRFASQVDVNNDLSKPVTTHYLPKEREYVVAKPHHMIAPGSSRWKPTGKIFKIVGLRWIPTGKIFTSSTTKVDSETQNGSNDDITNQYECKQTLDVSAGTLNIRASTSLNPTKEGLRVCSELGIHDHNNEPSSSKLVPKVVPPADKTATSRQEMKLLFHHHITMMRIHKDRDGDASSQLKSDLLPHAHAHSTRTFYKHQDSRIMKA
ncbi:hypothetical protein Tco_1055223 [Tanacetum coccineum]|uniref:Uncharacterized protein n=1 Tax=Tanacetum coccineum TaxID=301880 RepID=A0ABQ5GZ07_9ASTR